MEITFKEFFISDDKSLVQVERVYEMLSKSYWAKNRTKDTIKKTIDNSYCFGIYKGSYQIGFARCVTDYAVIYYIADVIIDEKYRGCGLGRALIKCITEHDLFASLFGVLNTNDAQGLYQQFGFKQDCDTAMNRRV